MSKKVLVYGMTNNPGGIETYLINMALKMKKVGIQFDFLCDFPDIVYMDKILENESEVYFIPPKGKKLFGHWKEIWKVLNKHPEYEHVYFNILDAGAAFSMLIPWLMRRNIIVHSHNGATDKVKLHKICRPFLNFFADKYVSCSKLAAEFMFGNRLVSKQNILIIPNAIDGNRYEYDKDVRDEYREKLNLRNKYVVCHVGRMSNQKNPLRIIDIFQEVWEKEKNAVLLYIGTGEMADDVINYVDKKTCKNNIRFLGTRKDVAELMKASDVFLLPSLYEGLPIVAVEAQTSGLPVIVSTAVTKEVDLTGNVVFVDLKNTNEYWAETVLKCKNIERRSYRKEIAQAGYDNNDSTVGIKRLRRCFRGKYE